MVVMGSLGKPESLKNDESQWLSQGLWELSHGTQGIPEKT